MLKKLKSVLFAIMACWTVTTMAATVDKIVVFGDSLSDTGNIFSLTTSAHAVLPIIPIIPKLPPYYDGRFSNGPIWIDQLSDKMNLPVLNYAYGGSWAEPILQSKLTVPFGLGVQVNYFLLSQVLDFHKDRHLYVIWTGGNDYISGRSNPEEATNQAVQSIREGIESLIYYGAKNILVLNLPDLGIAPAVRDKGKDFALLVSQLSDLHDKKLSFMLSKVQKEHPDLNVMEGNVLDIFTDLLTNPAKYHINNTMDACYDGGFYLKANLANSLEVNAAKEQMNLDILNSPSLREAYLNGKAAIAGAKTCANPNEYVFWDQLHPTAAVHQITANMISGILAQYHIEAI